MISPGDDQVLVEAALAFARLTRCRAEGLTGFGKWQTHFPTGLFNIDPYWFSQKAESGEGCSGLGFGLGIGVVGASFHRGWK